MRKGFFDYTIYHITEGASEAPTSKIDMSSTYQWQPFVAISEDLDSELKVKKLRQILSSINLSPAQYKSLEVSKHSNQINAIDNKKVTRVLIFGQKNSPYNQAIENQAQSIDGIEVIVTYSITDIIAEEKTGATDKRRTLWACLKAWKI